MSRQVLLLLALASSFFLVSCDPAEQPASDANATANRLAEEREAAERQRVDEAAAQNVTCIQSIRLNQNIISSSTVGSTQQYTEWYRERLKNALGKRSYSAIYLRYPKMPEMTADSIDPFLDASYPAEVEMLRSYRGSFGRPGLAAAMSCIKRALEAGVGPSDLRERLKKRKLEIEKINARDAALTSERR